MKQNSVVRIQNNVLITLLKNTLQICSGIRQLKGKADGDIKIGADGCEEGFVWSKEGHNLSEGLLNFVLLCCQKSVTKFNLQNLTNEETCEVILMQELYGLHFKALEVYPNFGNIQKTVEKLFLSDDLKKEFIDKLKRFEKQMADLNRQKLFAPREFITEYLLSYVDILTFLLKYEEFVEERLGKESILKPLLNFVDLPQGEAPSAAMSLFSPVSMYLLLMIYYRMDEYVDMENNEQDEALEDIFQEIFEKKVLHSYRWFLADENHGLYPVALTPFIEKPTEQKELLIPVHRLESYNSFEGIRELRLAEKIIFELEEWKKPENTEGQLVYKVAVLGDLQNQPIRELGKYLTKLLDNKIGISSESWLQDSDVQIHLDVYTKTEYTLRKDCYGEEGRYSYSFHRLDGILTVVEQLNKVLEEHEQVFMLDNIDLYKGSNIDVEEYRNPEFYKQRLKYYNYAEVFRGTQVNQTIANCGPFKELHELLTVYLYSGKWGEFRKKANDNLLQHLEDKIRQSASDKSIYVYVSDLDAFHELYCNDKYFVRKEQYCDKEIGIIRYSKRIEKVLINKEYTPYMLVFNIWQFIKHIVIEKRDCFLEKLLPGINDKADLKQIYVGIQYDCWKDKLILDYCFEQEEWENTEAAKAIVQFMKAVLLPVMNQECGFMYNEYIHKAMCSFLYGDVADIEDMLFVHLFRNHRDCLGKTEIASEHRSDIVRKNINLTFKYSFKRFFAMAMENFDISASQYIEQYKTVQAVSRSEALRNAWRDNGIACIYSDETAKETFFKQLLQACKNLGYTDSYLYKRCREETKEN